MNSEQYDAFLRTADWLAERDLPVALTLIETLEPSLGPDAVVFPPTYARRGGDNPYAITHIRSDLPAEDAARNGVEANICDLDSVGSQANRMEPIFKEAPLSSLVPQVFIKAGDKAGDPRVSLFDAGHRIADGAVRFTDQFKEKIAPAIEDLARRADASALAKIAPTSLIFGFWDSRNQEYQYKHPRLLTSTIRAANVAPLKRSAQYNPTFDPAVLAKSGNLGVDAAELTEEAAEPEKKAEADKKNPLSQQGLLAAPAVDTHGGVRVFGRIVRRTEINLVALRALAVTSEGKVNEEESLRLRRYLLGLALVAARAQAAYNLRQGCLLVGAESAPPDARLVFPSGRKEAFAWDFRAALEFAQSAAREFGAYSEPPAAQEFGFQYEKVTEAIKGKAAKADKKAGKKAGA